MKRLGLMMFALGAYCLFLLTFLYLVGFVGDFPMVPRSIDHPVSTVPMPTIIAIDSALIVLFGVQHSLMARRSFKAAWTRIVPEPIERSVYVVFASSVLILMFAFWQSLPGMAWDLRSSIAAPILWALFAAGWAIVLTSTYLINHFELFGLSQAWKHWRSVSTASPRFRQPLFYKLVRHPLYTGFLLAFWATPAMTFGHLLFATGMSVYILIAIEFEERDLVSVFGEEYVVYQRNVGKVLPGIR